MIATYRRMTLDTYPHTIYRNQIILKWIKDLNVKLKIIKLIGENIQKKILEIGLGSELFHMTKNTGNKS